MRYAPPTPSRKLREEAMDTVFGRSDLELWALPRAQLARVVWHLLDHDPDLVLNPIVIGWALDLIGRDFWRLEPALHDELCARLDRQFSREWTAYRALFPQGPQHVDRC
jgi:hypothetical protein